MTLKHGNSFTNLSHEKAPKAQKISNYFFLSDVYSYNILHSINKAYEVCFGANYHSLKGWGNFSETHFEQSLFPYFVPYTQGKYEGNCHVSLMFCPFDFPNKIGKVTQCKECKIFVFVKMKASQ